VMGAGAVGAYFGARLQQAGEQMVFCARGEHLRALKDHGLKFSSYQGDFSIAVTATDDPRDFAPYDLILFCVKSYDSATAARTLEGCLNPGGAILTLQNGVENETLLAEVFGREAVMGGNARVGAELVAPGHVVHRTGGLIEFGELDGRDTTRAQRLAELFRRAGIFGELTMRLPTIRWEKLLWNAAFNTVTTLVQRKVGDLIDDPDCVELLRALMHEIAAVARAEGVALGDAQVEAQITRSRAMLREVRPSTLQDSERGKPLEYEALSGAVIRTARRHQIATPHMDTVYALMKLLDRNLTSRASNIGSR
ncbi:MAG: 2-dehydropantoate 2-reductase, partial [Candidatus Binataceae bacterium]|nr:2-dehydropantoate 2-reductase [Candidatus Binataceae bacterium]